MAAPEAMSCISASPIVITIYLHYPSRNGELDAIFPLQLPRRFWRGLLYSLEIVLLLLRELPRPYHIVNAQDCNRRLEGRLNRLHLDVHRFHHSQLPDIRDPPASPVDPVYARRIAQSAPQSREAIDLVKPGGFREKHRNRLEGLGDFLDDGLLATRNRPGMSPQVLGDLHLEPSSAVGNSRVRQEEPHLKEAGLQQSSDLVEEQLVGAAHQNLAAPWVLKPFQHPPPVVPHLGIVGLLHGDEIRL